jgi:hypothetical protein
MNAKLVMRIGRSRRPAGLDRRVDDALAGLLEVARELDDQDRVLAGEARSARRGRSS